MKPCRLSFISPCLHLFSYHRALTSLLFIGSFLPRSPLYPSPIPGQKLLLRTIDNFREAGLKGSIFSRPKKRECRRRQEFKIDGGSLTPRRPNGAAHPCASHPRACRPHKSCTHHMCASCGSRLLTTSFRTATPRSREAPYALSDHTHARTLNSSLTLSPIRRCSSHP